MSSDVTVPDQARRRRFGLLMLGIAVVLSALFATFTLLTRQWWMLAFLVLVTPNLAIGVRELRAGGRLQRISDEH